MQKMSWAERIVVDPEIHHGEPCIRGTRVPVAVVLGSLAQGLTPEEIIREYPSLSREDIQERLKEVYKNHILALEAPLC